MVIFLLFVRGLCCYLWVLDKGMLISFLKECMLVLVLFFEVESRQAAVVDYLIDVLAIFVADVWRN